MTATSPVCPPPATKGAARAVAAPAAPALGVCTPPSPFAYVSFLRGDKRCRSNVVEREIAEGVAAHYRKLGFRGVQVVPA